MSQIKSFFRSLTSKEDKVSREFNADSDVLADPISRRTFLKLAGATIALAQAAGCAIRRPIAHITPYSTQPNGQPDATIPFATTMVIDDDVVGLTAKTIDGRPIKLDGNPTHPNSKGKSGIYHQAAVLSLYDPDRRKSIEKDGKITDRKTMIGLIKKIRYQKAKTNGKGLAIIAETSASPTFHRLAIALKTTWPDAIFVESNPISSSAVNAAAAIAFGKNCRVVYRIENARTIVAFDADLLGSFPDNVRHQFEFSQNRTPDRPMNRLFAIESTWTLTGSQADHRLILPPHAVDLAILQLGRALLNHGIKFPNPIPNILKTSPITDVIPSPQLEKIVQDCLKNRGKTIIAVGRDHPIAIQSLVLSINYALGNIPTTISLTPHPFSESPFCQSPPSDQWNALSTALTKSTIDTVIFLGGNPIYDAPIAAIHIPLSQVATKLHVTDIDNDTTAICNWKLPRAHFLETWGDGIALDGTISIAQPVISPMTDGFSSIQFLGLLSNNLDDDHQLVMTTMNERPTRASWKKAVQLGRRSTRTKTLSPAEFDSGAFLIQWTQWTAIPHNASALTVVIKPDYHGYDGRFINNGWLQELPHPITKLTWDNAALMSPETTRKLGVTDSDVIIITHDTHRITMPVLTVPGLANDTIELSMGYGQKISGRIGNTGHRVFPIGLHGTVLSTIHIEKTTDRYPLSVTQTHGQMEGRDLIRTAPLAAFLANPTITNPTAPPSETTLVDEVTYTKSPQWGMVIDLSKCTGCNVCIVSCQAENNIPIVGKDQVARNREMHWMRVDRYFSETPEGPGIVQQPVPCLQCENAPCEAVCPVAATTHTSEGLNDMTYNRCLGTRYCANNCPAKVRHFNFLDYHQTNPTSVEKTRTHLFDYFREPAHPLKMQFNPDVTVRMRGVIEKCTYCVQRIESARIASKREDREIADGEIQTACQQSCPSQAIVFGNIADPHSAVAVQRNKSQNYEILSELRLKARTTYLPKITNPIAEWTT